MKRSEVAQWREDAKTSLAVNETSPRDRAVVLQGEPTRLEAEQSVDQAG
ncbi:hypothetical protein [Kitasatospora aureofaciens]